jgi:tetratricopeptide (TPR) repeat protein
VIIVNPGLVIVGSIGDDLKMDYTAIGDTVNLASRVETAAGPGTVLISNDTYKIVKDYFEFEPLSKVKVKGKEEPLETYELIRPSGVESRIGASIARGLTRFVGRERETQALKEAFDRAQSGAGQVVGIVGEAGVGKSRLLFEMRKMLPPGEYTFLEGPCHQYGGSMGYLPILDILRSYLEVKEGDREHIVKKNMEEKILGLDEKLASVLPPFQELLSLKVNDDEFNRLEPKDKRERTFEAIRNLLIRLSQDKPLVLAVEDLHWIDKTSEEFLDFLIGSLAANRILLILLYRPEYTHQWGSKSYYAQIGVDQLKLDHCAELVRSILEEGEVAPELRELILGRAAGNPLFMEELTHTLLENGSIERKEGRFVLSARVSEMQIPGTVQGIIAARMDRLEENIKRTMQVASVIGRDFAFRILHTITEMKEELKSYLNNLQRLEFIYEKSLFPELEYIFKHALTQEVAYNSLLIRRRKEIHEKIGRAIEELYPERLEEFYEMLAYHYSKGENWEKAYRYYKLSGEKEMGNYSNWEAYHFYQEAINALKQLPDIRENKMEQIKVCLLYAIPMELLGCPEDSLQTLEEGERLAKELGDERSLARFYMALSTYYTYRGDHLLGKKYSEDSFNEAKKLQDIELMAPAALAICFSCLITGQYLEILDIAPDVIALLEKTKREPDLFIVGFNVYSFLCAYCGFGMGFLGNFEEGEVFFQKGLTNAAKIDDIVSLGLCEVLFSYFWGNKGEGRLCIEHSQKGIKYLEEANWPYLLGIAWANRGSGYYLLGDLESAQKDMEKGLSLQTNSGVTLGLAMTYFALSITLLDSGDTKKAERYAIKALELSRERNEKPGEGLSLIVLGRIWGKAEPSKTDKARKSIEQGIRILEDFKLRPGISLGYSSLGELYADTGQKEQARENLRKALGMMEEMGIAYWPDRAREVLGRLE